MIITNKAAKSKKGALVAIVAETKAEDVNMVMDKVPEEKLNLVEEVTLDMSSLLFDLYPDIQQAYSLTHSLRMIYNKNTHKLFCNKVISIDYTTKRDL
jgi:hypothetical protein